jgi:transposase
MSGKGTSFRYILSPSLRTVCYWCTDESRWELKTLTGHMLTLRGVKPMARVQWPRDAFWLYGAVEPLTGQSFFYRFSHLDAVCFELFLQEFAAAFADTMNLIQMDQAGAHLAAHIRWPENVLPILQPSHSPQLNPVERLWQELRKYFKGKSFLTIARLEEAVFTQINRLSRETITSLTGYSYILEALHMQVKQ